MFLLSEHRDGLWPRGRFSPARCWSDLHPLEVDDRPGAGLPTRHRRARSRCPPCPGAVREQPWSEADSRSTQRLGLRPMRGLKTIRGRCAPSPPGTHWCRTCAADTTRSTTDLPVRDRVRRLTRSCALPVAVAAVTTGDCRATGDRSTATRRPFASRVRLAAAWLSPKPLLVIMNPPGVG